MGMTRIVMNEPTGLYQVAYIENAPPLFRVQLKDGDISDWVCVKDLLRERDELRAKLERIKRMAEAEKEVAIVCRMPKAVLGKILKECE